MNEQFLLRMPHRQLVFTIPKVLRIFFDVKHLRVGCILADLCSKGFTGSRSALCQWIKEELKLQRKSAIMNMSQVKAEKGLSQQAEAALSREDWHPDNRSKKRRSS